jgi:hypothetical protein
VNGLSFRMHRSRTHNVEAANSCQRTKQPPNRGGLMQYDGFNGNRAYFEFVLFVPTRLRQASRP